MVRVRVSEGEGWREGRGWCSGSGAMPTWLKLIATAVESARSEAPNQFAESSGGVHWKKGCAAPTSSVPSVSATAAPNAEAGSAPCEGLSAAEVESRRRGGGFV